MNDSSMLAFAALATRQPCHSLSASMLLEEATEAYCCVFFDLQTLFNPALAGCGIAPVFVQSIF